MLTDDEHDRVTTRLDVIELRLDEITEQIDQLAASIRAIVGAARPTGPGDAGNEPPRTTA